MTPLQSILARVLPGKLTFPVLVLIYAVLAVGVIVSVASVQPNIYLDID